MAYRVRRGLGTMAVLPRSIAGNPVDCRSFGTWLITPECWGHTLSEWDGLVAVAVPGSPTGTVLTTPPASGTDAQATVDALTNQQVRDQQAANAAGVQSSWWDETLGGASNVGSGISSGLSAALPWLVGIGAALAFGLVAVGGGSPRRYGR